MCSELCVFQDDATELVVFVLHSLKNQREGHMMGDSCDDQEERSISTVTPYLADGPFIFITHVQQCSAAEVQKSTATDIYPL